jgi:hypothetical protein
VAVKYLGSRDFGTKSSTYTPPTNANYFIFAWIANASGGTGEPITALSWDGFTDSSQDATEINNHERVTTNGVLTALWELHSPDVSGQGTYTWSGGNVNNERVSIMAFSGVDFTDPTYAQTTANGSPDNETIDPGWIAGGAKVCVVAHNGSAETPASGFTEVQNYAADPLWGAEGYRVDDGYVGWNVTGGDRGSYCAVTLRPAPAGSQAIWAFSKRMMDLGSELKRGLIPANKLLEEYGDLVTI